MRLERPILRIVLIAIGVVLLGVAVTLADHEVILNGYLVCGRAWRFAFGGVRIHGGESVQRDPVLDGVCRAQARPYFVGAFVAGGVGAAILMFVLAMSLTRAALAARRD